MGRLPVIAPLLLAGIALVCCEERPKPAPSLRRADAVSASPSAAVPVPAVSTKPSTPRPRRTICKGKPVDRDFPTQALGHGEAPGHESMGTQIRTGHGKWVWVNLWAAWCGPCKEELPLLLSWKQKWEATADFVFVSLDDDQRQFLRFLQQQPREGLRTSFWLPEGKTRAAWLADLGVESSPELPIQILVNPKGKVHCIVHGAVEPEDIPAIDEIIGKK